MCYRTFSRFNQSEPNYITYLLSNRLNISIIGRRFGNPYITFLYIFSTFGNYSFKIIFLNYKFNTNLIRFMNIFTAIICVTCCLISMVFAHGAGNYIFILFDDFSGNIPLLIVAFFECVSVSYVYGLRR